ncbi:alginate O-acetyltransferase AlgX-related protein [Methylobacterium brachiatum]|uniref:AlgX/AlgJ SGNH hydrolase-like domain-containing protein n=1 Tax=Methylobacterium brachiatum TaxID=269660 RepID=A0ABV1RAS3_9HYPH
MASSNTDHIHVGRDGWLFLKTGTNDILGQFERPEETTDLIWSWRSLVATRERRLRALGIRYRHVVAPDKLLIYDDRLDGIAIAPEASPAYRLLHAEPPLGSRWRRGLTGLYADWRRRTRWRETCIDLVTPMRAARDASDLYCRTDTHWSFDGCYLAYAEICRAFGTEPRADLRERPFSQIDHDGDLGSAFDPPRRVPSRAYRIQQDAVRTYASPIVEAREKAGLLHTLHVGANVVYGNAKATDPRRLALFGDSFSHVMPYMLTILLAETFREVHFVWNTSLDWSYIDRAKPDLVLTEVAERFMAQLPDDSFSLDAYVQERFGAELANRGA